MDGVKIGFTKALEKYVPKSVNKCKQKSAHGKTTE